MKITARELRQLLTELDNQEMTIRELRKALFDCEDQDAQLDDMFDWPTQAGVEKPMVFNQPNA